MRDSIKKFKIISAMLVIATLISTQSIVNAYEYSYIDIANAFETSPRTILLDTSKAEKVTPKAHTSIPFNLREFSEAEYFTSNIEDTPPDNSSLSEEDNSTLMKIVEETPEDSQEEILQEKNSEFEIFTPNEVAVDFFVPSKDDKKEEALEEELHETTYVAEVSSETQSDNEFEGKKISKIEFCGLKNLPQDLILAEITTKENALYNSSILQHDLQKIYSTGYFTDEMSVEPELNNDGTVSLIFSVKENVLVKDVEVVGCTVFSAIEMEEFIQPLRNKPQNLHTINLVIEQINDYYHEKGYILASVSSVDDTVDSGLRFTISEGIINKIDISGNENTKDFVITRNILTAPGGVYNEDCLKKDLSNIFSTQIFEEVNREIKPSNTAEGAYDITVVVKEKTTNSISLGGGIDTGLGAFGSLGFKEDNFLGRGQRVSLSGVLGSGILLSDASIKNHMNYQVELSFFEPYFINADNSLSGRIFMREMGSFQVPLSIERRIGASLGVEHKVRGYKNLSTSFLAGVEHIDLKEGDYNRISQLYKLHNIDFSERAKQLQGGMFFNLAPGVKYSSLDNNENPREGIIAQARFNEAIGISNIQHTHGRLAGMVTKFFPVFKKSSFSLTAKGGIKVHGDDMPEALAYRLGGPYTIRGYRMSGVGIGESFVMGSAELATPLPFVDKLKWDIFQKMRLTFFVDAGKVFDPTVTNILYDRPEHAITAGIGLRIYIPGIGPISVDYGLPITNPGSYGSEHGYFTFGTGGMNGVYGY